MAGACVDSNVVIITIELNEKHLSSSSSHGSKSNKKPWDEKMSEITAVICAFFNSSSGGRLRLKFEKKPSAQVPKLIDNIIRRIEQSVLHFVGVATLSASFSLHSVDDDGIQFVVKPANRFCTVECHLYLPTDSQVNPISFVGDSSKKVAEIVQPQDHIIEVKFKEHCKHFFYQESTPDGLRESQTVEFKHLKDEATSNVTLADRMTNKTNKLVNYVSAFATHDGGHIYYGIDDTTYVVEGQVANAEEREKIRTKVANVLSKMVWPVRKPELFWKIDFVPVYIKKQCGMSSLSEVCDETFVIVLSIAKCPGGVFVKEPESYQLVDGKVTKIPFPLWKQKVAEDSSKSVDSLALHQSNAKVDCKFLQPVVYKAIGTKKWSSVVQEERCMKVTQLMENLRNNGNWNQIDAIARKVITGENKDADLKLAVTFQCTAAAYRQNKYQEAYTFLQSYHSLLKEAKNPAIFEVQELYSWSAIKRAEKNYRDSYKYAYDALQKMQFIVPGWITAWFLCNAAILCTILSSEETEPVKKEAMICEAELYYIQALEHGQTIMAYKQAAGNLQHRVHINLAMLYLASSPNFNITNFNQTVPAKNLRHAQESLQAAEDFEGPPMTGFNEFHFFLAKSDLCLRYFQLDPIQNSQHLQKAIQYVNNALGVATNNDFAEVLHYAQSRVSLLQTIPQNVQSSDGLIDELLKNADCC